MACVYALAVFLRLFGKYKLVSLVSINKFGKYKFVLQDLLFIFSFMNAYRVTRNCGYTLQEIAFSCATAGHHVRVENMAAGERYVFTTYFLVAVKLNTRITGASCVRLHRLYCATIAVNLLTALTTKQRLFFMLSSHHENSS